MKNNTKLILIAILALTYGILIGEYQIFPYKQVANLFQANQVEDQNEEKTLQLSGNNVALLTTVNPDNLKSFKTELSRLIFGSESLPEITPDKVTSIKDSAYDGLSNLAEIEEFEIVQNYEIKSVGYIFAPEKSNNRLLLYHQGHRGDFLKGKETIKHFVEEGFTVYAFCMPLLGKNNQPEITLEKLGVIYMNTHERFKYFENPMQYFIAPIIGMVNYAQDKKFKDITMVGISGGGWTTTLCAAVDSRIKQSFPVAGTYPMFIRFEKPKKNYGDFEQTWEKLYSKINYLDMYIMGSVGKGRSQLQILNEFDPCCFDGDDHNKYASFISSRVEQFDNGNFDLFVDSSHKEHQISEVALEVISEHLGIN